MNKQEGIKELESLKMIGTDARTTCYNKGINAGITIVGKLDELQKPVVPKFVAEWIEYAKKKGDSLVDSFKPWDLYGAEYIEADRWIDNNQETFARAWLNGYEVEKEPLYIVSLPIHNGHMLVAYNSEVEGYVIVDENFDDVSSDLRFELTEKEIKSKDERYWPFAVPVEEVTKG